MTAHTWQVDVVWDIGQATRLAHPPHQALVDRRGRGFVNLGRRPGQLVDVNLPSGPLQLKAVGHPLRGEGGWMRRLISIGRPIDGRSTHLREPDYVSGRVGKKMRDST